MSLAPGGAPPPDPGGMEDGAELAGLDVAVLHDPVPQDAPPDQQDTLIQARDAAEALRSLGLAPRLAPFGPDLEAMRRELAARPPRLAFNLVESLAGLEHMAFAAPALLEALDIPHTGGVAQALLATGSKSAAKRRLRQAGLATPDWLTRRPLPGDPAPEVLPGSPFIIKPEHTHGSVGIGPESVVRAESAEALLELLARREAQLGQRCLAEVFVPGREFSVAVVEGPDGPEALPPAEMRFHGADAPNGLLCYASKWDAQSPAYANSRRAFPADEPALMARLADAALGAWRVFGLSGYARFDYRLDPSLPDPAPQCIDVNANPCLAQDAGLAAAAARAGLGYAGLLERIVRAGLRAGPGLPGRRAVQSAAAQISGPEGLAWREHVLPGDPEAVRRVTEATGFFNAEEIVIAGQLAEEHLAKGEASGYFYVFAEERGPAQNRPSPGGTDHAPSGGSLRGYACFGPTPGTADSYDLYWIAVDPAAQGRGTGGAVLARAEAAMAARGARGVYVETSSRGQYLPTRRFYEKHGYVACARLAGFYQAGDDKIIYCKRLG